MRSRTRVTRASSTQTQTSRAISVSALPSSASDSRGLHIVDVQDIPVGILEPRSTEITHAMDVALELHARHVVMLEGYAFLLQCADDCVELLAHAPGRRRRLVGAGELGLVDDDL